MMRWNICKKSLGFNTSGLMILTCILFSAQMTQSLSCIPSIYNSHFYTYCSDTRDRDTAEFECFNTMAAMRLAVFETEQDFDYWKLWFAIQGVTEDIWIGAQFSKSRNAWWWDVGFPVTLTFIDSVSLNTAGVKDGACMAIYQNEYLKELSCSQTRGFLCQESYNINVATQALPDTEDTTETATTAVQYEYTSQDMTSIDTTEGSTEPSRLAIPGEEDLCRCGCTGNATNTPRTQKERQRYLDKREKEIERKLYLDKEILSTNVRRKTSAEDSRQSAQSVGYVGVIMLALTFGSIFVMDVPSLWYNLKGRSSFVKARALKKQPKSRVNESGHTNEKQQ